MTKRGHRKISTKIPLRPEEMLARHAIDTDSGPIVPWDLVAPGLYPDEEVVELDSGEKIAVSIEPEWWENNGGVTLHAFARWIADDGSTKLDARGRAVETSHSASFEHSALETHSLDELAAAVTALVLGEDQQIVPVERTPDDPESPAERPMLWISARGEQQASVRKAIETVSKLGGLRVKV